MNFKHLLLVPIIALAACDGSDSSAPPAPVVQTSDSTFADAANAQLAALNDKVTSLSTKLADSQTKLDQLNGRIGSTDAEIGPVTAKIDALAAQVKGLGETANTASEIISRLSGDGTKEKPGEIAKAADDVARLIGDKAEPATIAAAQKRLQDLKDRLSTATTDLGNAQNQLALLAGEGTSEKPGIAKLVSLLSALDSKDDSGAIQKARTKLTKLTEDANEIAGILDDAEQRLAKLNGDGTEKDLGDIGKALAKLKIVEDAVRAAEDRLAALLGNGTEQNPGTIAKAREELVALTTKSDTLRETIKLQTARAEAVTLNAQGKVKEAAAVLKEVGLISEAAAIFTRVGMDEEAYKLYAPEDYVVEDPNTYMASGIDGLAKLSLESSMVNEISSVKRHSMSIRGETVWFTARAGHLIVYTPKSEAKGMRVAKASIFYTSYTRDDLPKEKRPVTFFFNGGPGSASIWLHLGSWAPQRLISNAPEIPEKYKSTKPQQFDKVDNAETLLDQTDLVFYDPVGTGLSQAISPNKNKDFWQVDKDAGVLRDFVTRYTNVYNRQASPKYLYGESYGGIRTPIAAYLLLQAGTADYEHDPSGIKPSVLAGFVLNSPILDYSTDCGQSQTRSCAGYLPSYAAVADFHKKAKVRVDKETIGEYFEASIKFTAETFAPFADRFSRPAAPPGGKSKKIPWLPTLEAMDGGKALLTDIETRLGILRKVWEPDSLLNVEIFRKNLLQGQYLSGFDGRMYTPSTSYDADDYLDDAFPNQFRTMRADYLNYKNDSTYTSGLEGFLGKWDYKRPFTTSNAATSLPELTNISTLAPGTKMLIVGGYHDIRTALYQTDLDLKSVNLQDRIEVKKFIGGHMTYNTEGSRAPMKAALDAFYAAPPYAPPAAPVTATIVSGALQ
jgi:pimeloyl-ACP methyl ester carboxylesterase/peptidoglycan hydrolase CwlO-like protein